MRDRDDIETLVHDTKQEAYDQKRKLALEEVKRKYWDELTTGDIAEAISESASEKDMESIEYATARATDAPSRELGMLIIQRAVADWIAHQAEQEIQRRERKGEFV